MAHWFMIDVEYQRHDFEATRIEVVDGHLLARRGYGDAADITYAWAPGVWKEIYETQPPAVHVVSEIDTL